MSGFLWFAGQKVEILDSHHHLCLCRGHLQYRHQPMQRNTGSRAHDNSARGTRLDNNECQSYTYNCGFSTDIIITHKTC